MWNDANYNRALSFIKICKGRIKDLELRKDKIPEDEYYSDLADLEYELECWENQRDFGTCNPWAW